MSSSFGWIHRLCPVGWRVSKARCRRSLHATCMLLGAWLTHSPWSWKPSKMIVNYTQTTQCHIQNVIIMRTCEPIAFRIYYHTSFIVPAYLTIQFQKLPLLPFSGVTSLLVGYPGSAVLEPLFPSTSVPLIRGTTQHISSIYGKKETVSETQ
jgi:hypothetical protein